MNASIRNFFNAAISAGMLIAASGSLAEGFTITLTNGKLYGPGDLGTHDLQDGTLFNFVVTGAISGSIPFFNNGGKEPNTLAETLHTGPVDGKLSDGTLINENVNAAFVLSVQEPQTGEMVELMVGSVSEETVESDDRGNLTFKLDAGFDPGLPEYVVKMPVQFTTGAVALPDSEKTTRGIKGGKDFAGPFPSGTVTIGRLGDADQDGFLDGTFVLADKTPFELIIAEGDPVVIVRPFKSDIPVNPKQSGYYELSGVVNNFRKPVRDAITAKQTGVLRGYQREMEKRLRIAKTNVERARLRAKVRSGEAGSHEQFGLLQKAETNLSDALDRVSMPADFDSSKDVAEFSRRFNEALTLINEALQCMG